MGKTISAAEFTAHAHQRIHAADAILQRHQPYANGICACGRSQPCPAAATCQEHIAHYRAKLAILDATQLLPVIQTRPAARPSHLQLHGW